jgi:hypothetical protein
MEGFDAGWEHDAELDAARGPGLDDIWEHERAPLDPEVHDGRGAWPESVWAHPSVHIDAAPVLFAEPFSEAELRREMRIAALWARCQDGVCTVDEFFELSALITKVEGLRGSLCVDCAMLGRPNTAANWALSDTTLCKAHLRFRLGHVRIDGGGSRSDR